MRSQAGVDRGVDLEQITARLALAKSNLVVTEANIENAKTDYQAVMGYLPVSPVKPAPFDSEIPATMQTAEKIALDNIRMRGYGFQIEMKYNAYKLGYKIKEVPIIFIDRKEGVSKMSSSIFGEAFWGVLWMKLRRIRPRKTK